MTSYNDALRMKYSDPVDPWAMLDSPWGRMPAWKVATYATGAADSAIAAYNQVRNDSANLSARHDAREAALNFRADALDERERQIGVMAAQVSELAGRISVEWDKLQKGKADAEEEPLALPPGHKSEEPEPALSLEDEVQPAHGDPPGSGDPEVDAALPGDPSPPVGSEPALSPQKQGSLFGTSPGDPRGEFLRLKYPVARDQAEFPDPELPHPPVQPQPIAAGLDEVIPWRPNKSTSKPAVNSKNITTRC